MSGERRRRWRAISAVMQRDLLEFVRDRRTLFVTLLMPMAMYPVLALASTLGLRTAVTDIEARQAPRPLAVALSGPDAVAFAGRLEKAAWANQDKPADWPAELAVRICDQATAQQLLDEGEIHAWIDLPLGTAAALDGRSTVPLEARISAIKPLDGRRQDHVVAVVEGVARDARRRRLAAEGLPTSVLEPIALSFAGGPKAGGGRSMEGIVPTAAGGVLVLLALLTATGAFYPAIDAIAGEKERGTIETLLIAPASTGDIVTGKFLAIWIVTLATLLVNAVSIAATAVVLLRLIPVGFDLGIEASQATLAVGITLVAFVGLAAVAAAVCLAVTSGSRSGKEAQNTLTPVILLVSGLAGSALLPGTGGAAFSAIPFAGQVCLAREALAGAGGGALAAQLAISLAASAAVTWLLLRGAAAAISDEELLFRGPDSAGGLFTRPAQRTVPTPMQGFATALVAFAGLWYAQGMSPANLAWAVPIQQAALIVPLVVALAWQRVDLGQTFGLKLPGDRRWPLVLAGGLLAGAGLFIVAAAATLAVRGTHLSGAARDLAERIMDLLLAQPWWAGWLLVAVLPAVFEELFFRGWLLSALGGARPEGRRAIAAVLLQAAAFAAFHLLPERMPQTFMLGIALGWMTLATGSLLPAMAAHLAHNSVPLVLVNLVAEGQGKRLVAGDASGLASWLVLAAAAALVVGLALLLTGCGVRPPRLRVRRSDA
jgi:sodium transport system permease protein